MSTGERAGVAPSPVSDPGPVGDEKADGSMSSLETRYRLLAEHTSDIVALVGAGGVVHWVSPSLTRILGWSGTDMEGRSLRGLLRDDDSDRGAVLDTAVDGPTGTGSPTELRMRHLDGGYRWMAVTSTPLTRADDPLSLVVTMRDVTEHVEARKHMSEFEAQHRFLVEHGRDVVAVYNPDWTLRWVSASVARIFGLDPKLDADHLRPDLHPDDGAEMGSMRAGIANGDDTVRVRARLSVGAGDWVWTESVAEAVRDADGSLSAVHVVTRNVHDEVLAGLRLAASERRFRLAMVEAPHGMAIVGLDHRFMEVNPALCRILGRREEWMLAHAWDDVLHPGDAASDRDARLELLERAREHVTAEQRFVRSGGHVIWVQHALALLRDESGEPVSYVSQVQDITGVRRAMAELEYQASHDALTGLLNRHELTDRLDAQLTEAAATGRRMAVLFCDVDRLKFVNDELGHAAGDAMLLATAQRLASSVRASDLVARVGGDEFVILLDGVEGEEEAVRIAEAIRRRAAEPVLFETANVSTTVSIGILLTRTGASVDAVLRDADAALYAAKAAGRDRVAVHRG